jgi:pimeloyl-ACP methyl ester carboxylesterase
VNYLLVFAAAAVALAMVGWIYQQVSLARDARRYPCPGKLVTVGSGLLHINIAGSGSPPVVLESGMASSSLAWSLVQPEIAKFSQTVSYDRFGLGWSDAVPNPREIRQVVSELRTLLERASVSSPRVLVAHSYGGLIVRAYANRYPQEVAGIILLDPVAASEWSDPDASHRKMLRHGIFISRFCAWLASAGILRFLMNRWAFIGSHLPQRPKSNQESHGFGGLDRIVGEVKKLPREVWPVVQAHWCHPKCLDGMAEYFKEFSSSAATVRTICGTGGEPNIPLTVLSAGNASAVQRAEHEALARSTQQAKLQILADTGHWIHFDRPDTVISAIREMIAACQADGEAHRRAGKPSR